MNVSSLFSVEGLVVVITGGATGLGLMMTKAFALNGAKKVYIIGRRKDKLDEAAKLSPNIVPIVGDVTSKEALIEAASTIKKDIGYVNIVICNSGVLPPPIAATAGEASIQEFAQAALQQNVEDWNTCFATNATSVSFTVFAFLELLDAGNKKANAGGRKSQVIVTSSIASFMRTPLGNLAYSASKAATTHLTKHLSSMIASYEIRVNALAPGLFQSDLAAGLINVASSGATDPTIEGSVPKTTIPAGRTGHENEIIGTLLYLASAAGAYVNGNILVIDGGRIATMPSTY